MGIHYKKNKKTLYRKVAEDLEGMITRGLYEEGTRLPSIRQMSSSLDVSINTIIEAYSLLETWQLVEGRPQKGFFVKSINIQKLQVFKSQNFFEPITHDISEDMIYQKITKEIMDPDLVPLGAAAASTSILPVQDINSLITSLSEEQKRLCLTEAPVEGLPELRRAIACKLIDCGLSLSIDEIIITAGCVEALYLSLSAITNPGDTIAIQTPIYFNLVLMFRNLGLKIIEIPSDPITGIYLEVLEYAIKRNSIKACVVISNFSNPTGSSIPNKDKKKLTEILKEADIPLLEDDVFGDLYFTGKRPTTCRTFDDSGNTVLCSSFSKTVFPGFRLGYIIPGKLKDRIIRIKMGVNICTSTIPQLLLANYLESGGFYRHLRKLRREIALRMKNLRHDVFSFFPPGTRMTDPQGGYTLWIKLPGRMSGLDVYNKALKEGISIVPGGLFSQDDYFDSFIRLDAGCYTEDIRPAVKKLGAIIKELLE